MTETRPYYQRLLLYVYVVLANTYGVVTCLLLLLWLLSNERFWLVRLFLSLVPPLLIPALIALPIGLLVRRWRPALFVTPAVIVFFVLYGAAFLPKTLATETPNLTVLTYNVHTHNTDYEGVEAIVRDSDADIIAMQEMRPGMVDFLEATFSENYPYRIVRPEKTSTIMLSRYPIRDAAAGSINYAVVDFNGQDVMVFFIHLPVPQYAFSALTTGEFLTNDSRQARLAMMREISANADMPQVLMGDFNMSDGGQDYRQMARDYTDVFRTTQSGLGLTFPNWRGINPDIVGWPPLIRIDYVFVSNDVIPIDARVLRTGQSDHYALLAHLYVNER